MLAPALLGLAAAVSAPASFIPFTPDQQGSVSAPVVGIAAAGSDYLLTGSSGWATLPQNFSGNDQWVDGFANPSTARDAASYDQLSMLQLDTLGNTYGVNTDGSLNLSLPTLSLGGTTFGIGYAAGIDTLGYGQWDGTQLTLGSYDLGASSFGSPTTVAFDPATSGTPTGLDYLLINNQPLYLVTTRDWQDEFGEHLNHILVMNGFGTVIQYTTTGGTTYTAQDATYNSGRLTIAYNDGGVAGYVDSGTWTIVPEPTTAALALVGAFPARRHRPPTPGFPALRPDHITPLEGRAPRDRVHHPRQSVKEAG